MTGAATIKATILAIAVLGLPCPAGAASFADKQCIVLAVAKLPPLADMKVTSSAATITEEKPNELALLIKSRIDAVQGDAEGARRLVTGYRSLNNAESASIDAAKGKPPEMRQVLRALLARWVDDLPVTATVRRVVIGVEVAGQKVGFASTCETSMKTGEATLTPGGLVDQ